MRCPRCGSMLKLADEQGVEIDYCPACQGVWLEAGELEQLMTDSPVSDRKQSPKRKRDHNHMGEYDEKPRKHVGYPESKKSPRRRPDNFDWDDALDQVTKHRISKKVLKKLKDILD